jgi:hypothetical protein
MKTILETLRDAGLFCLTLAAIVGLLCWEALIGGLSAITGREIVGDYDEDRAEDLR